MRAQPVNGAMQTDEVTPKCLHFGPAGKRCSRPAAIGGFCEKHDPERSYESWASPLAHGCCGATPDRVALAAVSRRLAGIAKVVALVRTTPAADAGLSAALRKFALQAIERIPASSNTRSFRELSSTCSNSNRKRGQSVRMDIFSGHSTMTMAGSAKRSSTPRVSKS